QGWLLSCGVKLSQERFYVLALPIAPSGVPAVVCAAGVARVVEHGAHPRLAEPSGRAARDVAPGGVRLPVLSVRVPVPERPGPDPHEADAGADLQGLDDPGVG